MIIPTGWLSPNHSVGVYAQLIDEQLIIIHCNKGAGINDSKEFNGNSGVLIFEGKPGFAIYKMLSDLFYREKFTISKNSVSAEFYLEFEGNLEKCGFKNIGFIPLQKQKIGICSIVNKIGLVAGIEAYQDKIKDKETWEASAAKKRYKEFTTACRKQEISLLVDRINKLESLQDQMGYQMLIDLIERKAEKACQGNLRSMDLIKFTVEKLINKIGKANSDSVISDIKIAFMTHITLHAEAAGTDKERKTHEDLLNKTAPIIKELDDFLTSQSASLSKKSRS